MKGYFFALYLVLLFIYLFILKTFLTVFYFINNQSIQKVISYSTRIWPLWCIRKKACLKWVDKWLLLLPSVIPWTVARQAPLSMEFSTQGHWGGLPFPPAGYLPDWETEPASLVAPALAGEHFTTVPPGKPGKWLFY